MTQTQHIEPSKRQPLNLRISNADRAVIDQAATLAGKTRTDFVLDAARKAAEETLLDRTFFTLSPKAFAYFNAMLDKPMKPNAKLKKLLQTNAPWE